MSSIVTVGVGARIAPETDLPATLPPNVPATRPAAIPAAVPIIGSSTAPVTFSAAA